MARRKNPIFDPVNKEIEAAVGGSMVIVDRWFDEWNELTAEQTGALDLESAIKGRLLAMKKEGDEIPKEEIDRLDRVKEKLNRTKQRLKLIDSRIAKYYKASLKDLTRRLEAFKATPGSAMSAALVREYRDAMKKLTLAKKQAGYKGVDIRPKISELRGSVASLEEALKFVRPSGATEALRAAKRGLAPQRAAKKPAGEQWVEYVELWKKVKARATKSERYKSGRDKIEYAESKSLKPTLTLDVRFFQEVTEADLLMRVTQRKISRGEDVSRNLPRLKRMINSVEAVMRERPTAASPGKVISSLAKLRKDMLAYQRKKRFSPRALAKFGSDLAALKDSARGKGTAEWSEQDRRTAISSIRQLEAVLVKLSPVPGAPVRARIPVSAISKRSGNPKKKATKKKTAKKATKNPSIWNQELTPDEKAVLAKWVRKHPTADKKSMLAALKWYEQLYGSESIGRKGIDSVLGNLCYSLGRQGSCVPEWMKDLAKQLGAHRHCERENKSGLRDSGRANPGLKTKKAIKKKTAKIKTVAEVPSDKKTVSLIKGYCKKKMAMLDATTKPDLEKKAWEASEALEKVIDYLQKLDLKKGEAALLVTTSCQLAMDIRSFANKYGVSDAQLKELVKESEGEIKRALKNPKKNPKKKTAKRKAAKKKVARKTTPEWQRLIRRCQKLWDHYCERPGKKRLQDVLKHLEKMKGSASKKVLDERKKCMSAAKAEAKRLKLK